MRQISPGSSRKKLRKRPNPPSDRANSSRGCSTREEAIENIKSAISEYVAVTREMTPVEVFEKKVLFVDVPDAIVAEPKPFKIVPIAISLPHFTKVEDLLDILEGPDRLY